MSSWAKAGPGDHDQLRPDDRRADIVAGERQRHRAAAVGVGQGDPAAVAHGRERRPVAPPQPHLVAPLGEIGDGGIGAVAAAEDGDAAHRGRARAGRRAPGGP